MTSGQKNRSCSVLVTGGSGFIGAELIKKLVSMGHSVYATARSTAAGSKIKELSAVAVKCDITSLSEVKGVFNKVSPRMVFHCAASVKENDEKKLNAANIIGTRNIALESFSRNVGKLVYLSSVAVISGNVGAKLTDDMEYAATNGYGRSKIEAERLVLELRGKGLRASILRPCMVYGEKEPHMLPRIFTMARARMLMLPNIPEIEYPINIVHVDDVVRAILLAAEKEAALEGTFIIADKKAVPIRKLFEIIYSEISGRDVPMVPRLISDIILGNIWTKRFRHKYFKPRDYDIGRARDEIGYDPQVELETGMRQVIRAWKKDLVYKGE